MAGISAPSMTKPKPPSKVPPKAVTEAIIRRFLKEGQPIYWKREVPTFYRLFKVYPNVIFWQHLELPFGEEGTHALNLMSWFEGEEGKPHLERAWLLFNYTPPELDIAPQVGYTGGGDEPIPEPPPIARRPKTVAELLAIKTL